MIKLMDLKIGQRWLYSFKENNILIFVAEIVEIMDQVSSTCSWKIVFQGNSPWEVGNQKYDFETPFKDKNWKYLFNQNKITLAS